MSLGCQHYQRKIMFLTPCCRKEYICRRCHDANEKHTLDRKSVTTIVCLLCKYPQAVSQYCIKCRSKLAEYFCAKCRMYDDVDKGQFHCDKCDICRVGYQNNFFHCDVCNGCFNKNIRYTHKCIENSSRSGCTVCLEDIHSSTAPIVVPVCGHLIHKTCFDSLKSVNIANCPTCRKVLMPIM